jgi:glycosyltransferase involved in cell wall biosynthesis
VELAYRTARFSVLPSLHEGYGLPVAESLAWGTPVITTSYGSTQQVASSGGALLIDPRDDEALVHAMRRLLTDDHLLRTLQQQARNRPTRTWEQYASELWDHLVRPELTTPV